MVVAVPGEAILQCFSLAMKQQSHMLGRTIAASTAGFSKWKQAEPVETPQVSLAQDLSACGLPAWPGRVRREKREGWCY